MFCFVFFISNAFSLLIKTTLYIELVVNSDIYLLSVDLVTYLTKFQWDLAKYPIKQSLKNIAEIIGKVGKHCIDIMIIRILLRHV